MWRRNAEQAFHNLAAAKLRSFLAVLGILVGTAAIVALISSGELATEKALQEFKALGTDLMAVTTFSSEESSQSGRNEIPLRFWRHIPQELPDILAIAPYGVAYQPISFQGHILQGPIIGADESLASILHLNLEAGFFVSFLNSYEQVCVIGSTIAQELKKISVKAPIGSSLRIGQSLYRIIGVLKPWQENGFFNEDINQAIIVPVSGLIVINKNTKISNAIMRLKPDSSIDPLIEKLKQLITTAAPKLNVFARSAKQIIASMESQGRIFTLLLGVIGGISLLVGGIGIMNV
ncbi:MAG: ABC transporter permease, partial [Gammaproteobacteria bacterium]|nr:ABC transporter permease [Gammaproteobacteria bacterium]